MPRLDDFPRRWITLASLLVIGLIGWRVLSLGMADHYAKPSPARALSWRADHPLALVLEAERLAGEGGDAQRAEMLARRALQLDPLNGRGYAVLAQLADRVGDSARAASLHALALKRSPRHLPSHAWLFDHALRAGRVDAALGHADLMLRIQPELAERLFPILIELAMEPAANKPMVAALAKSPAWREKLLLALFKQAPADARLDSLVNALIESGSVLSRYELTAWLDRLVTRHDWGQAYAVWASQLPEGALPLSNVYNGGFEAQPANGGFDWRFEHVPGASIELLADAGVSGRQALSVGFDGQRVPFQHVRQLLVLSPGRYLLEGHQRADGLRTENGLQWTMTCAESGAPVGSTEPLKGNLGWSPFSTEFTIPASDCGGQWLQLSLRARTDSEQMVSGRAWFDELRVVRL